MATLKSNCNIQSQIHPTFSKPVRPEVVIYRHCGDFEPVVAIFLSDKNVVIFDQKISANTDQNKVYLPKFEVH